MTEPPGLVPWRERTAWAAERMAPLRTFLATESGSSGVLVAAVAAALIWANADPAGYERIWHTALSLRLGDAHATRDLRTWVDDGLMTRWGIQEVYGLHNMPGLPEGHIHTTPGAMLASADLVEIKVIGKGGHGGAGPHKAVDSVLIGSQIVSALQSIVARNVDPLKSAVISITQFNAGTAFNIIPETAELKGTVRTLDPAVRDLVERRIGEIADSIARAYGGSAETKYTRMYPVTMNHAPQAAVAADVARDVVGAERVNDHAVPLMGGEDFAFMLEARPGAFVFLGMGDGNDCHHPAYRFNDNVLGHGASYWVRLVEKTMPAG